MVKGNPQNWRPGKRLSAQRIVDALPAHKTYVEPFAGRAYVFLKNMKYSGDAILNDLDCGVLKDLKKQKCSLKNPAQCEKLEEAKVSCGKDWKKFLKYDAPDTLFYLDPPYEDNKTSKKFYKFNDVSLKEVLDGVKNLKGTVALSYSQDRRKEICNLQTGFRCRTIKTFSFGNPSSEILAIKKARYN